MSRPEPWAVNVPNSISMLREYALVQTDDARHVAPYLTCALNELDALNAQAKELDLEPVRAAVFAQLLLRTQVAGHEPHQVDFCLRLANEAAEKYKMARARIGQKP